MVPLVEIERDERAVGLEQAVGCEEAAVRIPRGAVSCAVLTVRDEDGVDQAGERAAPRSRLDNDLVVLEPRVEHLPPLLPSQVPGAGEMRGKCVGQGQRLGQTWGESCLRTVVNLLEGYGTT